jgi:phosphatidylcholine synthase
VTFHDHWVNFAVVILFCLLTVAPIKVVHPVRVRELRRITLPVVAVWFGVLIVYTAWDPRPMPLYAKLLVVVGVVYLAFLSTRKTRQIRRAKRLAAAS